ncbi:secretion protein F [Antrihabitans sp. YC3-6]|uniref:Secretion protein F n=1 Tax=Antrihabitans stalagmiti TaxID=2799499 RepID=A0A934NRL9_9NOCA|nr:secretion protein F [Antrihabitans stalagmiti]MBJ8340146.1 secretion protein F [Antrihabitans stalagmiti]
MTLALVCIAAALIVAPSESRQRRLDTIFERAGVRRGFPKFENVIGLCCMPAFLVGGLHGLLAAAMVVLLFRRRRATASRDEQMQVERRKLLDGIDIVIGELKIGAHPAAAAEAAAAECSGVVATVLAVAAARSRLGGSGADGIEAADTAITAELGRIGHAWRVAETHGLALAELLTAARTDILGRLRFRSRTESSLAGARATGTVLAGLPVLGILLGQLMGAAPLTVLLGGGTGGVLLVVGTAFACVGLLWTDAITSKVVA